MEDYVFDFLKYFIYLTEVNLPKYLIIISPTN